MTNQVRVCISDKQKNPSVSMSSLEQAMEGTCLNAKHIKAEKPKWYHQYPGHSETLPSYRVKDFNLTLTIYPRIISPVLHLLLPSEMGVHYILTVTKEQQCRSPGTHAVTTKGSLKNYQSKQQQKITKSKTASQTKNRKHGNEPQNTRSEHVQYGGDGISTRTTCPRAVQSKK